MAPFKGGTLVPAATILLSLPTSGAGGFSPTAAWPPGVPPGASLWFQVWQPHASGVAGFVASNGLRATVP
jgi:hypothetical protein